MAAAIILLVLITTIPLNAQTAIERVTSMTVRLETEEGNGSGVIIGDGHHILTAAHVANQQHVTVRTPDDKTVDAHLLWSSKDLDLALLKTDSPLADTVPSFVNKKSVQRGSRVYVVGFPWGDRDEDRSTDATVTQGIISRLTTDEIKRTLIQIDAAVNPGNSGGPLVDEQGRIVGVVVEKFIGIGDGNVFIPSEGIAYAVPAYETWPQLQSLGIPFTVYEPPESQWYDSLFDLWKEQPVVAILILILIILIMAVFIMLLTKRGRSFARVSISHRLTRQGEPIEYELLGITGHWRDQRFPINSEKLVIGRDPMEASIVLASEVVSKRHCSVMRDNASDRVILTDEGSSNGTLANDTIHLQSGSTYSLSSGDRFSVGSKQNVFQVVKKD